MVPAAVHSGSEPVPAHAFERHEVAIGAAERLTVLTGFLSGGSVADLAAVYLDGNGDRRLRVFSFAEGDWSAAAEATLRPEVTFVDVARIDGRDRLIAYGDGRLTWFDPESATERDLVAVTSDFKESDRDEVLHVDMTRDLNGDGRDDVALVHGHGFQVLVQMPDGRFAEPVTVGPTTGLDRVYGADGYRYRPWEEGGRIHEMDYDLDGRGDLVFWDEDHFAVHLQDERGQFPAKASTTFTIGISFDSDQIASLAAPTGIRSRRRDHMPEGESSGRVLHSLTDMNGDGRSDLLVARNRKRLDIHLGVPGPALFAKRPQRIVVSVPNDEEYTWLTDLNLDGKQDVLMHHPLTTAPHRVTVLMSR